MYWLGARIKRAPCFLTNSIAGETMLQFFRTGRVVGLAPAMGERHHGGDCGLGGWRISPRGRRMTGAVNVKTAGRGGAKREKQSRHVFFCLSSRRSRARRCVNGRWGDLLAGRPRRLVGGLLRFYPAIAGSTCVARRCSSFLARARSTAPRGGRTRRSWVPRQGYAAVSSKTGQLCGGGAFGGWAPPCSVPQTHARPDRP